MQRIGARRIAWVAGMVIIGLLGAASAAGAAPGPADATASRAFDEVKPAVVRVVTVDSEQVAVHLYALDGPAVSRFLGEEAGKLFGSADLTAAVNRAYEDLAAKFRQEPANFVKPVPVVFRTKMSTKLVGSGTVVDGAGTVVTAASLTPSRDQIRSAMHAQIVRDLTRQIDDALSFLTPAAFFAQSSDAPYLAAQTQQDVVNALRAAVEAASTSQLTYEVESSTTTVQVGPAVDPAPSDPSTSDLPPDAPPTNAPSTTTVAYRTTAPAASGSGNYPATVVYQPKTGDQPVAVLAISARGLPSAPLAASGPADGEAIVVAGYGAAKPDGTDLTGIIRPSRVSGTVHVTGGEPIPAQISFTDGHTGGPALDTSGQVRGVAVMAGGQRAVIGVEQIRAALVTAHRTAAVTTPDGLWRTAIGDGSQRYYKRAVPELRKLQASAPAYPYVADLLDTYSQRIAAGQDRTPHDLSLAWVVVALLGLLLAGSGTVRAVVHRHGGTA